MALIHLIKNEKAMRRIFGERELKIIERQLLGINLSASEKTRLSRDIRPKFEIINKISDFKEEFRLKKAQHIKYLIEDAKEVILKSMWFSRIRKILIFGSTAKNMRTFRSDIDLAVVFDEIQDKDAGKFRVHVLGRVSDDLDIQVYNVLPDKIKREIDKDGKIIYERKDKR